MKKEQEFAKIVKNHVKVNDLKLLLAKLPVKTQFKEGLINYLENKGLFKSETCSSFVLGVAFGEFVNKNVDPTSDDSMRDFHVAKAILANPEMLQICGLKEKK